MLFGSPAIYRVGSGFRKFRLRGDTVTEYPVDVSKNLNASSRPSPSAATSPVPLVEESSVVAANSISAELKRVINQVSVASLASASLPRDSVKVKLPELSLVGGTTLIAWKRVASPDGLRSKPGLPVSNDGPLVPEPVM